MSDKTLFTMLLATMIYFAAGFLPQDVETSVHTVDVKSGDTVWEICERLYDKKEVRCFQEFVDDVRKENNLMGNNVLREGKPITVRITKRK